MYMVSVSARRWWVKRWIAAFKRLPSLALKPNLLRSSKQKADEEAIVVFAENLRQLLLAAPLGQNA